MTVILVVLLAIVAIACGVLVWFAVSLRQQLKSSQAATVAAKVSSDDELTAARAQAKEIVLEAKDEAVRLRTEAETDIRERRAEAQRMERRVQQKEENLDKKVESLERKERGLAEREDELDSLRRDAEALVVERKQELERVSGMTREEARDVLLGAIEGEVREDANQLVRRIEAEARETADERAQKIITMAIQRWASDQVSESSVSVVPLPNEEMKGRIIGREGRNIRALEMATGVDLIIDDTPEAVLLSGFDPVRREVARLAVSKLVIDGRIHPARIEEMVERAKTDVDTMIKEEGERAAFEASVPGLNPDLVKALGRLHFRYSMGQNVLKHSVEVAHLCGMMAAELGADVNVARRAGLLHDIGKGVSHEVEGPHALIGADIAKRLGQSNKSGSRNCRPSLRRGTDDSRGLSGSGFRCHLGHAVRRQARHSRDVRQASRGARKHRQLLRRRREELRHPGRTGGADIGQARLG